MAGASAEAVARICRRLDGIPLAIEMAAARLRALPVEVLADRLEDALCLLTDGNRAALPRHRTLRATIEWSHDLLSEREKILLRRLAVFAGGWTLEAAEEVCPDEGLQQREVLDLLLRLVDRSLVVMEQRDGEGRYRFLEMIRQFAREQLAASGEEDAIRRRHTAYFLALAESAEPELARPQQQVWLDRLEQERGNLRAVQGWAVAAAQAKPGGEATATGLRLAAALKQFWFIRGEWTEGRAWLASLLDLVVANGHRATEVPPITRARALCAAGTLAWPQGDLTAARALLQESLSLAQQLGDRPLIAQSLLGLGTACGYLGDFEAARTYQEESLSISRKLGDRHTIARLCNNLGIIMRELGEHEQSRSLLEESLQIARDIDCRQLTVTARVLLGIFHMIERDYSKALADYEESRATAQEVGDPGTMAVACGLIGTLALYQRDLVTARARYAESLRIGHTLGGHVRLQDWLMGLGCVEIMSGETTGQGGEASHRRLCRGTCLFGAAEALREATGGVIWAHDRADYERCVASARAALGEAGFTAAWAEGRAMSLDETVTYALEDLRAA